MSTPSPSAPPMPDTSASVGLLVSVRSLQELRSVAELGIDVLDFKEPWRGPLAAASPQLWRQAAAEMSVECRLSAALGEWDQAVELAGLVPPRFAYAKAGPAGVQSTQALLASWAELRTLLASSVELVAVAYADHRQAQCPQAEVIFRAAAEAGIRTWLLDTFEKSARLDSTAILGPQRLSEIQRLAQQHGARWVLAGSIRQPVARKLLDQGIRPALFGVRGDVCQRSRDGRVVPAKVTRWLELLRPTAQQVNHGDDRQRSEGQA